MASQIRRSSKSIPVNIAEGMGKQESNRDVKHYIRIALGSNDETKVWLEFSKDLGYVDEQTFQQYEDRYNEIGRMIRGVLKRYSWFPVSSLQYRADSMIRIIEWPGDCVPFV